MDAAWIDPREAERRYPHLFGEVVWPWGPARVRFELFPNQLPPHELIANVNLVARCVNGWLILRLEDSSWEVLGGTLEAGESCLQALQRELMEVTALTCFWCWSLALSWGGSWGNLTHSAATSQPGWG